MHDRTRTAWPALAGAIVLRNLRPRRLRVLLARVAGAIGFRLLARMRRAVTANLSAVTGNRRDAVALARRVFENYCLYVADYMMFPELDREGLDRIVAEARGGEHLERGRAAILVTPHVGNWELGGIWLARNGFPLHVVSLPDEDERTEAFRNRMRRAHGIRPLRYDPRSASPTSMMELLDVLKKNELLAMLTDRAAAGRTERVPYFGRPTDFPIGPFVLSWLSGAPVVPSLCVLRSDARYVTVTDRPIHLDRSLDRAESIRRGVEEMARRFEGYVRAHPDQWYNFYPFWKDA